MASYTGTNAEGNKARSLAAERQKQAMTFKAKQEDILRANTVRLHDMSDQFQTTMSTREDQFKAATIGLVSAEEFKRKRMALEEADKAAEAARIKAVEREKKRKNDQRKKQRAALTFNMDEEEQVTLPSAPARGEKRKEADSSAEQDGSTAAAATPASTAAAASDASVVAPASASAPGSEDEPASKRARSNSNKDPTADTSFLPDRARDAEEAALRDRLESEWRATQEKVKSENVQITYSYWDGSGHRNRVSVEKGSSIGQFLEKARKQLVSEFHELRGLSSDGLLYIKEDLLIPHQYTFYELIVTKARGKSGPLFHFDVHDDIRMLADASVEKDESHAGKIVTKSWYERNKNNFPASRWEVFEPGKERGTYTIKGREVRGATAPK